MGGRPMSMKRFPYRPAERRAVVNATFDGKNATFVGGRGNSTDGEDKVDKALNNVYESFEALDDSVSILEDLGWACTDYSAYKRDSAAKKITNTSQISSTIPQ